MVSSKDAGINNIGLHCQCEKKDYNSGFRWFHVASLQAAGMISPET